MTREQRWEHLPLQQLSQDYPQVIDFLAGYNIDASAAPLCLQQYMQTLPDNHLEEIGSSDALLVDSFNGFMRSLHSMAEKGTLQVNSLSIIGGQNKSGEAEAVEVVLLPGSVSAIVGPTGSGKSRLLADIEWMAQGDTPTKRHILINGQVPDRKLRFSLEHKLVAQLSQNMNFVMDTTAAEFIAMHAQSRMRDADEVTDLIIAQANHLAGEKFSRDTPVTALSGGQSRALMIADTAFLSTSPVVLIDEIENAGIDRKRALDLLIGQNKIVLMSTHDPILALMGDQRLVIKNGGIARVITTSAQEKNNLQKLEQLDYQIQSLRQRLRSGERIEQL